MYNNRIDSAIIQSKKYGNHVNLKIKMIHDQEFIYLLKKDTKIIIKLNLHKNFITPVSMYQMKRSNWNSLMILQLTGNKVGDKGSKYLSRVKLAQLKQIKLGQNQISSYGLSHLVKAQWNKLEVIYIDFNKINQSSIWLSTAKWMQRCITLIIWNNNIPLKDVYQSLLYDVQDKSQLWMNGNDLQDVFKPKLRNTLRQKYNSVYIQL